MTIHGHSPGRGASFTPSLNATWTEDFNELLREYNKDHKYSRNRLTEKCVELGLQVLKNGSTTINSDKGIYIPIDGLSESQVEFLNSVEGQKAIQGIIKMMLLGNPGLAKGESVTQNDNDIKEEPAKTEIAATKSDENLTINQEQEFKPSTNEVDIDSILKHNKLLGGETF